MLSFDFFSKNDRYEDTAWANDPKLLDPAYMRRFGELVHQHPIVKISLANPNGEALRITDAVNQSEFERTDLFTEVYRREGINKQMGCALLSEGDLIMTYAFSRMGIDFSDRERAIATAAAPHYINAIRNGFAFGRLSAALESGGSGVIALNAKGDIAFSSSFVRKLLEDYFTGEHLAGNRLPQTLSAWLGTALMLSRMKEFNLPVEPLRIERPGGRLTVRLLDNRSTREEILLLEETKPLSPESFGHLPVTKREGQILFWITQGKADADIATLCGISIRTVQKHVENIYTKLGVETRTAAMLRALETAV